MFLNSDTVDALVTQLKMSFPVCLKRKWVKVLASRDARLVHCVLPNKRNGRQKTRTGRQDILD